MLGPLLGSLRTPRCRRKLVRRTRPVASPVATEGWAAGQKRHGEGGSSSRPPLGVGAPRATSLLSWWAFVLRRLRPAPSGRLFCALLPHLFCQKMRLAHSAGRAPAGNSSSFSSAAALVRGWGGKRVGGLGVLMHASIASACGAAGCLCAEREVLVQLTHLVGL